MTHIEESEGNYTEFLFLEPAETQCYYKRRKDEELRSISTIRLKSEGDTEPVAWFLAACLPSFLRSFLHTSVHHLPLCRFYFQLPPDIDPGDVAVPPGYYFMPCIREFHTNLLSKTFLMPCTCTYIFIILFILSHALKISGMCEKSTNFSYIKYNQEIRIYLNFRTTRCNKKHLNDSNKASRSGRSLEQMLLIENDFQ